MVNTKRQTIPIILSNADLAIYYAYVDSGVPENSNQSIQWYIEVADGSAADLIKSHLDKVLADLGGFDIYSCTTAYSGDGEWSIIIETTKFLFDSQNVREFSQKLFKIAKKYGAEYRFWSVVL